MTELLDGGWEGEHFCGGEFLRRGGSRGVFERWVGTRLLPSGLLRKNLIDKCKKAFESESQHTGVRFTIRNADELKGKVHAAKE